MALKKFIIERDLPAIGSAERAALQAAAAKSNEVLAELGPNIQWVESYVANDKTFCVYLAADEAIIRRHAEKSGFPANRITDKAIFRDPVDRLALFRPWGGRRGRVLLALLRRSLGRSALGPLAGEEDDGVGGASHTP